MRKSLAVLALSVALAGSAFAQIPVTPGTASQVNRAIAEAPGTWADAAVELVVSRGIYIGYPDGTYRWPEDITRAEMAVVIARMISSFNLEAFDPDEIAMLRQAVSALQDELGGLTALVAEHDGSLADAAAALDRHEAELAELWNAIAVLQASPAVFDASELWLAIEALEGRADATDAELDAIRDRLAALEDDADTSALAARLDALTDQLHDEMALGVSLRDQLGALEARVAALERGNMAQDSLLSELENRVGTLSGHLALLEARVHGMEADLSEIRAVLADHEERITRLEDSLLPDRAPFNISLALYGSAPNGGLVGQVAVGHDAIVGNLGARLTVDFGFGEVPLSVSGAITYRATVDSVDGYAGVGMGASFEETGTALFGELILGAGYRFAKNFGVFIEGRYRPYFDGSGDGLAALGGGVRLRF